MSKSMNTIFHIGNCIITILLKITFEMSRVRLQIISKSEQLRIAILISPRRVISLYRKIRTACWYVLYYIIIIFNIKPHIRWRNSVVIIPATRIAQRYFYISPSARPGLATSGRT